MSYFEDFEKPRLAETKKMKMSLSALPDMEDCKYLQEKNKEILQSSFEMRKNSFLINLSYKAN